METRISSRVKAKLKVSCRINGRQKFALACGEVFEPAAVDISEVGIGLISKYFLPKGLTVELAIEGILPDAGKIMKVKGEVRYSIFKKDSGYRCGVKFLDMPDEYRKSIAKLVAAYERREFPRVTISE